MKSKYKCFYRGKWYMVEELVIYPDGSIGVNKFQGEIFSPDQEHIKCVVRYIGVNYFDKEEIYEGDIVKYYNRVGVIQFKRDKGGYGLLTEKDGVFVSAAKHHAQVFEKLGNIYENPERV